MITFEIYTRITKHITLFFNLNSLLNTKTAPKLIQKESCQKVLVETF